ncbi:AEC family transporter [Beggiatoa leptomitoformis]|uniref:AEC family transporter n=1 Tax=Beggiatoa leptomitoformis TaxID=288004 RepID=A0A2N9YEW2_9GAMM|nr:AEC family transporter [Beggiatoa leptomitoformis]ALG68630.1 AEC family transporter [Beggiatoa leptomitoformis]AUI69023.1 AEC family transporter [Beggiatoa leptomitoformis]
MLLRVFSILFPVFAIVAIGYFYARRHPIDMSIANRINLEVFTPCLLFSILTDKSFNLLEYSQLAIVAFLLVMGSGLLMLPVVRLLGLNAKTFIPSMMFANTGNMGLPVAYFAFDEAIMPAAVVLFIVSNALHFTVGSYMMNHHTNWLNILKKPMILATLMGITLSFFKLPVPTLLLEPLKMLGQISVPLMLFALGVRLINVNFADWEIGLRGAIWCPLSGVLVLAGAMPFLTFTPEQAGLVLIYAMLPPAVMNYMIAEQYQQEPQKVASIVMLGNLMSLITMPLALLLALPA